MANAVVGALRVDLAMNAGEFSRGARQARQEMTSLAGAISQISNQMNRASIFFNTGVLAAQRFAAVSQSILGVASTFEKGISNVGTLIDGTTENLAAMSAKVLEIGQRTPVSLAELTSALYDIRSAGIPAADAMAVLESSAQLAVAGLGTTKEAVDLVTSSVNAFGLEGDEAARIYDVVFKTVKAGKTTISQLAQGFGAVAGTVATAGIKIDEYLASVAALTTTGLPAAQAHTQLRAAIAGMTRESEISTKVLNTLGAKTFKDLIEKSGGMVGAFRKIVATLQANDANLIKLLGSVEAYNAVIGVTGKQNKSFTDTLNEMRFGADAVGEAFEKQNSTIFAATSRLMNTIESLGVAMGNALAPAVDRITKFADGIAEAFNSLTPEMQELVAKIGAIALVTGPAIIAAGFFANALASLIPVIAGVTSGLVALAVAGGPITIVAAAITALGVVIYNWGDDVIATFRQVIEEVKSLAGAVTVASNAIAKMDRMTALDQLAENAAHVEDVLSNLSSSQTGFLGSAAEEATVLADTIEGYVTPAISRSADAFGNLQMQTGLVSLATAEANQAAADSVPITDLTTEATNRRSEAQRYLNQMMREGKTITEQMLDPMEKLAAMELKLADLQRLGAISADTAGRAMQKAAFVAANAYTGMASDIAGSLSKVFGESKGFAIAQAIINTAEGVTKALAAYPPPFNFAAAAAVGAAGAAQIAAIKSTNKGGGGGRSGGVGGGNVGASAASTGAIPQAMTVNLHGQTFGREQVFGLIDQINQAGKDGKHVIVRAA